MKHNEPTLNVHALSPKKTVITDFKQFCQARQPKWKFFWCIFGRYQVQSCLALQLSCLNLLWCNSVSTGTCLVGTAFIPWLLPSKYTPFHHWQIPTLMIHWYL